MPVKPTHKAVKEYYAELGLRNPQNRTSGVQVSDYRQADSGLVRYNRYS